MAARARTLLAYASAGVVLAAVFFWYLRPDMMVAVGEFVWSCFPTVR